MLQLLKDDEFFHCTIHIFKYMLLDLSCSVFSPLYNCVTINMDFFFPLCFSFLFFLLM